jgi:hypothetical protein
VRANSSCNLADREGLVVVIVVAVVVIVVVTVVIVAIVIVVIVAMAIVVVTIVVVTIIVVTIVAVAIMVRVPSHLLVFLLMVLLISSGICLVFLFSTFLCIHLLPFVGLFFLSVLRLVCLNKCSDNGTSLLTVFFLIDAKLIGTEKSVFSTPVLLKPFFFFGCVSGFRWLLFRLSSFD